MIVRRDANSSYSQLLNRAKNAGIPVKVVWEVTQKCNFRCIHCYVAPDKRKKELTTRQIMQIIDEIADAGCFYIHFTGGEPLLRTDIFQILYYANQKGFRFSLATNISLVNQNVATKLAQLKPSLVELNTSIPAVTRGVFEKITGIRGSFNKVSNAVRLLQNKGVKLSVNTVLLAPNKNEFLQVRNLANQLHAEWRCNFVVLPKTDRSRMPLKYSVSPEVVHKIIEKVNPEEMLSEQTPMQSARPVGRKGLFMCGVGSCDVTISPYGEMNFCPFIHYPKYDILTGSFKDGWSKIRELVKKIKLTNYYCKNCVLARFCPWCPAEAWLTSGNFIGCSYLDREIALFRAKSSPLWSEIAPLWRKQRRRFSGKRHSES